MLGYQPVPIPEPVLDLLVTKAVVGAAVHCLGVRDEGTGVVYSLVTFDVNLSQSGAAYWTQIDVRVEATDSQAGIRSKTIAAVKEQVLEEFGFTMATEDVILSNYYVGS